MLYTFRELQTDDLNQIIELYERIYTNDEEKVKDYQELKWLFSDPNNPAKFNGFIAIDDKNNIAGVIGYVINTYKYKENEFTGVIPMSWMILPENRGILGIQLLLKIIKLADFGFAIEGSETAKQSYKAAKLKYICKANVYTKVLKPFTYYKSLNQQLILRAVKSAYYFGFRRRIKNNLIRLNEYKDPPPASPASPDNLINIETRERINWLLSCPLVETYAFTLEINNEEKGTCICYIQEKKDKIRRGRIVHISYIGTDIQVYREIIVRLERFLAGKGCCSVSVLALNPAFRKAVKACGYRTISKAARAVYVRDENISSHSIPFENWHITYYESDKAYRSI